MPVRHRFCTLCRKTLFVSAFVKDAHRKSGYSSWCKKCKRKKDKKRRNNIEVRRKLASSHRYRTYGLTDEQYTQLLRNQKGCCAICKMTFSAKPRAIHVDHDHKTNMVRGLLCRACNHALGLLRDNIVVVRSAMTYLKKYQKIFGKSIR